MNSILEIADELNYQLDDFLIHNNLLEEFEYLTFFEISYFEGIYIVKFLGQVIWDSENDLRDYIDEENDIKEDLKQFLIKESNKLINIINIIKEIE